MNCKRSFGLIGKTTSIAAGKVSVIFLHLARLATRSGLQREKNSRILSRQSENTGRPAEWHFAVAGHQLVRECNRRCNAAYNRRCNAAYPVAIHDKTDYLYTGKELQQLFGIDWSDSFARFQTTSGVFTSPDHLAEKYYSLSPYNYCAGDPVNYTDTDGRDAVFVTFKGYNIESAGMKIPGLGHAGILLINNKTGLTKYYEYGRYDRENIGVTRSYAIPNVVIGEDGKPTKESLDNVFEAISVKSGKGHSIKGAYIESDEFDKMNSYAKQRLADNDNPERQVYSLTNNNCSTFAADVISSDEEVKEKLPLIQLPVPNLFIIQLRMLFEPVN